MHKRGINTNIFVFIIAIVLVGAIFVIGYRFISDTTDELERADIILLQRHLGQDVAAMKQDFGSFRKVSYEAPAGLEICIADLKQKARALESEFVEYKPLLKDSLSSNSQNNVFFTGPGLFESFFIGDLTVSSFPHVMCFSAEHGQVTMGLEGSGAQVDVISDFDSRVELDSSRDVTVSSPDGIISLDIPKGTSTSHDSISITILEASREGTAGDVYEFKPRGMTFSPAVELRVKYSPSTFGACPDELYFYQYQVGGEELGIPSNRIDCENRIVYFLIREFI